MAATSACSRSITACNKPVAVEVGKIEEAVNGRRWGDDKGPQDLQKAEEKATVRRSLSMSTSRPRGYAGEKDRKERKIGYVTTAVLYAWVLSCC